MIDLLTFQNLSKIEISNFLPKPTTLTEGQEEAAVNLWKSEDGLTKLVFGNAPLVNLLLIDQLQVNTVILYLVQPPLKIMTEVVSANWDQGIY